MHPHWRKPLTLTPLALLGARAAQAGPIALGIAGFERQLVEQVHQAATVVGPLVMLVGGGRAAWIAYRGEDWVWPFIQALLGTAIFAAAT